MKPDPGATTPDSPIAPRNSDEYIEDVAFSNLIRRWTEAREYEWLAAANVMYGHVLEERERSRPAPGTPDNPIVAVVVDEPVDEPVDEQGELVRVPDEDDEIDGEQ